MKALEIEYRDTKIHYDENSNEWNVENTPNGYGHKSLLMAKKAADSFLDDSKILPKPYLFVTLNKSFRSSDTDCGPFRLISVDVKGFWAIKPGPGHKKFRLNPRYHTDYIPVNVEQNESLLDDLNEARIIRDKANALYNTKEQDVRRKLVSLSSLHETLCKNLKITHSTLSL